MRVVWTKFAAQNLKNIFDYYAEHADWKVAHKIRRKILDSTRHLNKFPEIGPPEPHLNKLSPDYRFLLSGNYKIIYRIENKKKEIIIIDVFDTRQHPSRMSSGREE